MTQQLFLAAVELSASEEAKEWATKISDSLKIRVAKEACKAFEEGTTYEEIKLLIIQRMQFEPVAAGYVGGLVGAGVETYCPEYNYKMP